jgi:hypothetical protein
LSIDWKPSRHAAAALAGLGVLGALAVPLSNVPAPAPWLLATLPLVGGLLLARRELRKSTRQVVFRASGAVEIDGIAVDDTVLDWRGPLTLLDFSVRGSHGRLIGWPDVIDRARRRELRLWQLDCGTAPDRPSVAP